MNPLPRRYLNENVYAELIEKITFNISLSDYTCPSHEGVDITEEKG
jgi:hypothetical protein